MSNDLVNRITLLAQKCAQQDKANATAASAAQSTADTAVSNAATAQSAAEGAQSTADTAVTNAATAQSRADDAYALAQEAKGLGSSAYHYEGTVATYAELPTNLTADDKGAVYNVGSDLTGMNYAWNGTGWDSLGQTFTVAVGITTDNGTALVPEGVAKTALAAKQDAADIGDTDTDFVSIYNAAYAAA